MANTTLRPTDFWLNSDGLVVRYGVGSSRDAVVGAPTVYGDSQVLIADIDYSRLPPHQSADTTGVVYGDNPNAAIPAGALIESAVLEANVAFAGATAVLLLGLVKPSATAGQWDPIDNDGLFNATDGAVANFDTVGEIRTGTGALIGTILASTGYLWATVTTADFTQGKGRLTVTYRMPAPFTHDGAPVYA